MIVTKVVKKETRKFIDFTVEHDAMVYTGTMEIVDDGNFKSCYFEWDNGPIEDIDMFEDIAISELIK